MSDLSKKTLISSGDTKNYIENYWTKRADAFAALRRQELHSENTASGSARSCSICRPQNSCVSLTLAAAPVFLRSAG